LVERIRRVDKFDEHPLSPCLPWPSLVLTRTLTRSYPYPYSCLDMSDGLTDLMYTPIIMLIQTVTRSYMNPRPFLRIPEPASTLDRSTRDTRTGTPRLIPLKLGPTTLKSGLTPYIWSGPSRRKIESTTPLFQITPWNSKNNLHCFKSSLLYFKFNEKNQIYIKKILKK
jgi:hypothetical protein